MSRLYPGMAFNNMKKSRRTYIPYMISCIMTVAVYYIVCSLAGNRNLADMWGGNIIQSYMNFGQVIVALFALIFLFYINSFLLKRRRSEFGLYNILGLEKRHISGIVLMETLYTFVIVMAAGILLGILLDKMMYLVLAKVLGGALPVGFYISGPAIFMALGLFGAIFLLILLNSVRQIYKADPVELLRSENTGEKEPKARWLLAVLGIICLGAGYYIAVTTTNPVAAFAMFFAAVILVIIGTYLIFTAGSIALLKLMRKNRGYYYKTKHFISVSSMMYRMKRNAVGLANICILSTMVLVMLSAVISVYAGVGDSVKQRYPEEFTVTAISGDPLNEDVKDILESSISGAGLDAEDIISYDDFSISAVYEEGRDYFNTDTSSYSGMSAIQSYNSIHTFVFVTLDDYNRCMGTDMKLDSDSDVLLYPKGSLGTDELNIFDMSFNVAGGLDSFMPSSNLTAKVMSGSFIVVKDRETLEALHEKNVEVYGDSASYISFNYMADVAGDTETNHDAIADAYNEAWEQISLLSQPEGSPYAELSDGATASLSCRSVEAETFGSDFTGLLFVGIFLGLLFLMATVLIMYYKQLTEGYEDKKRFEILQNVGMSHREVKKSINSQILMIFFLPLVTAGVHVAFDFPFIYRVLNLLGLFNLKLFAFCTIGCFLVFTIFYIIVYVLTSRLYYRIVRK